MLRGFNNKYYGDIKFQNSDYYYIIIITQKDNFDINEYTVKLS